MENCFLSIDTSSAYTYVSLSIDTEIRTESFGGENSHNEKIDLLIKELLGNDSGKINAILLGSGPGSFTGLRIGFAYAKGLAYALKIPVFQYSSLGSVAYYFMRECKNKIICTLADARRGEFFVNISRISDAMIESLLDTSIMKFQEINEFLSKQKEEVLYSNLCSHLPVEFKDCKFLPLVPLSQALIAMHMCICNESQESSKSALSVHDLALIEPFYLREVAAKTLKERGVKI